MSRESEKMKIAKCNEKEWLKGKGYSKKILFTEDELESMGLLVQIVKSEAHTEVARAPAFAGIWNPLFHLRIDR